jgi:hypothetical protein
VLAACLMWCGLSVGVAPAEPVLRLRAEAGFNVDKARVGDTVLYRLRIVWNDIPAGVMLNPRERLAAHGLNPAGRSVTHIRSTVNGQVTNQTEYAYAFVARDAGMAHVAPYRLRYLNGLSGREEEVAVPRATLTVNPAPWSGLTRFMTHWGVMGGALGVVGLAIWVGVCRRRGRLAAQASAKAGTPGLQSLPARPEDEAIKALRARCDTADARVWMRDAERLCVGWLCARLRITRTENVRFEAALDQYLNRTPGLAPAIVDGWTKLRDLFHESRYGGPRREAYELHATCLTLKTCLLLDDHTAMAQATGPQIENAPATR